MGKYESRLIRLLSRREALKVLGATSAAMLTGWAPVLSSIRHPRSALGQAKSSSNSGTLSSCVVRPEATEGPYYVYLDLNRSDVRSDPATGAIKDGALLNITFRVSHIINGVCSLLAGAKVEIWHCDAAGAYSDVRDPWFDTVGQKFLRGYQVTDRNGQAKFITIYPGWYSGRAVHIHFKVHHDTSPESPVFTSQIFFEDSLSDQVHSKEPYASKGRRDTLNSTDRIYKEELLLTVTQTDNGYAATFDIAL